MLLIIVSLTQSHHKMKSENKAQQRIKKSGCVVLIKILLVADNFLVYDLLVFTPW